MLMAVVLMMVVVIVCSSHFALGVTMVVFAIGFASVYMTALIMTF